MGHGNWLAGPFGAVHLRLRKFIAPAEFGKECVDIEMKALRTLITLLPLTFAATGALGAQPRQGVIRGIVTDSAGMPMTAVTLRISGTEIHQVSNAKGEFLFDRVAPGRYLLRASLIGAHPAGDSVVVRAGDTTHIRFVLQQIPFVAETLPPRWARGARPDTAPSEKETLDLVARVGKLPLLRARPPAGGRREIRFWLGGGIAIPETLIRLTLDGTLVRGEVIRYLEQTLPDRDANPSWRAFMDSVPDWLHRDFGCGDVATDTLHYPGAQAGYQKQLAAVCTVRYPHEPDWRALLQELEGYHVWTLPDESELPRLANVVSTDGGGVTVEAWDGQRYHSYSFGDTNLIPAPEAHEAEAIQKALIAFLTRRYYDLHPPPQ
jgi:hypothetical protein